MSKENKKNKIKKESKSILNLLIPDHLKRIKKNSEWCKTGTFPSNPNNKQ